MFKSFKDKLKGAFNRFAKEVDESSEVADGQEETPQDRQELKQEEESLKQEDKRKEEDPDLEEQTSQKKGFFHKVFKSKDEAEKAPTPEEIEDSEDTPIKEEKIEVPEDVPDELNERELSSFKEKINEAVKDIEDSTKYYVGRATNSESFHEQEMREIEEAKKATEEEEKKEKRGFIQKLSDSFTKKVLSEKAFNELFWELEITLLENNVAVEVIEIIKDKLKLKLVDRPISRKDISSEIETTLRETIEEILDKDKPDFMNDIKNKKPYKILVVGVNGSGKTTTIAKLVHLLKKNGFSSVLAASDTFRAAAIDQLQEHADNLDTKLIRHDYKSDPAAVAFDAIKYAESKKLDTVIIDTAGRLHSNSNLMDELKKVYKVSKPDLTIFVGESITGNDCLEQAKEFQKVVDFDAIILSKADVDEKGGAAISVSYVTQRPVLYLGVGQDYEDLEEFDKYKIMYRLFDDS
ncbi:MAG: signal recognition particle-docking protein FtsY [Candidatus Woesearchaeota archaeon]